MPRNRITVDATEMDKLASSISREVIKDLSDELSVQNRRLTNYIIVRHLTGGTTSDRLARRTSNLVRTTKARPAKREGNLLVAKVQFGAEYAPVHIGEKGTHFVIRRKTKKHRVYNIVVPRRVHPEEIIATKRAEIENAMRDRLIGTMERLNAN